MKSKYPLISVVMLNYNGLKYLRRTIPPILKLDYPNYKFIIVDNGSTDGSVGFIKKFKNIILIENGENWGYSEGKNIGVKNARGEYTLLLDNDILINDKKILKIAFLSLPMINIGEIKTKLYTYGFSLFGPLYNKPESMKVITKNIPYLSGAPMGGNIFFKRSIWNEIGDYDNSQPYYLDDLDIGARSYLFGYKNYVFPSISLVHIEEKRNSNLDNWSWKYRFFFSGISRTIIKSYRIKNIIFRYPIFMIYSILKTLKYSYKFKSFKPTFSYIYSIGLFLKNLPDTLKQRKILQSRRVIKEDIFLKIRPPKFD